MASIRAKFESFGQVECESDDDETKRGLKSLKCIGLRPQTLAEKKGKTKRKTARKIVTDPLQSKINDFFRGVDR